jgi:ATP-dependent Lhr-like helicase
MLAAARANQSSLLIAPTGAGKTLAGFLPSLVELSGAQSRLGLHTLYVSPLKALAADVARNLLRPVSQMQLSITIETRTGDTSPSDRARQKRNPPQILLTTPEQMALMIASPEARFLFETVRTIIIDEVHALAPTKRGDLLALALAAVRGWSPEVRRVGLSATVDQPERLAHWLGTGTTIVRSAAGAVPIVDVLDSDARIPWAGHSGRHAAQEVYQAIKAARMALVFVNTRSQAELMFQELWAVNVDNLPIALHHGSLDISQRLRVEAAMANGSLKAVVCTSTLDLGIDWGEVDLVIQIGAPKGASRLIQRIGRANHRLDEPSRALLAPTNRLEVLECRAAQAAVIAGELDGPPPRRGALDALAQHVMGRACGDGFRPDALFAEIRACEPYADLSRAHFDQVVQFVSTGGYALQNYERFRRILPDRDGVWRARNAEMARRHRMNVGAIVENPMLAVRVAQRLGAKPRAGQPKAEHTILRGGQKLGEVEEWFVDQLSPGDTFLFAGQVLRLETIDGTDVLVSRTSATEPKIPSYNGGKFPLSTFLAARVREMTSDRSHWPSLPTQVREWFEAQQQFSVIPRPDQLLVETFPRGARHYLVAYPFEGRLAHQTLGMLLTRRLERAGKAPLGFVGSEYALAVWSLAPMGDLDMHQLFHQDMLGDDLEAWLDESLLMKRTFRYCAIISGLIERRLPGQEKSGRQVTMSTDLIYDVLRSYEPGHILLQAARQDAGEGLLDIHRLGEMLARVKGQIVHRDLARISPFAVPVMLEIGKESVAGSATDALLSLAEVELMQEATEGAPHAV